MESGTSPEEEKANKNSQSYPKSLPKGPSVPEVRILRKRCYLDDTDDSEAGEPPWPRTQSLRRDTECGIKEENLRSEIRYY